MKKYFNIPNLLSFSRIIGGVLIYSLISYEYFIFSLILFIMLIITDIVDGRIAKKYKMQSKIGVEIDAGSDAILIVITIISIFNYLNLPIELLIIIFISIFTLWLLNIILNGNKIMTRILHITGGLGYGFGLLGIFYLILFK